MITKAVYKENKKPDPKSEMYYHPGTIQWLSKTLVTL